jgi:phosphotransferase system  glucose/maltose/N-acetylglucosamine-specific IIC component
MDSFFYDIFLRRWPVMLVALAGIVFAIIRWKRHPKVSALVVTGLILSQAQSLFFSYLYYLLPRLATRGWTWTAIDSLSIALDLCQDLFFSLAIALLAAAVFIGRSRQEDGFQTKRATSV